MRISFGKSGRRYLFWGTLLFCLLPFFLAAFLGSMAADDYQLYMLDRKVGLWAGLKELYRIWTGRYTAIFFQMWLVDHNIPERFYFLPTHLLLIGIGGAFYFFLSSINKVFLGSFFSKARLLAASLVLLLTTLYVQAEISTGFYWFCSAVTYQPPFIFSLLIAGLLIRNGAVSPGRIKIKYLAPALVLVVLTCGTTEIAPIYLMLSLFVLSVFIYRMTGKMPAAVVACLVMTLITGIIIILTSGIFSDRAPFMNGNTSLVLILPMTLLRSVSIFYYLLRVPAFWVVSLLSYGTGLKLAPLESNRLSVLPWGGRRILMPGLLVIFGCVFFSLMPILAVTRGAFPARSSDTLVDLTMASLLALLFIAGLTDTRTAALLKDIRVPSALPLFLLIVTLTATVPLVKAWESVFSGYFYHGMVQQRKQLIREALSRGERTVTIKPAQAGVEEMIHERFPNGIFKTVHTILLKKPALIFDDDGMEKGSQPIYQYYGLDSIIVKNPGD
jgi:hypothetical protein